MDSFDSGRRSRAARVVVEPLEQREMLAAQPWAPAARLIGQDLAVANYPELTGAGESVVIIDSGVDYKHPSLGGGLGANFKVAAGWDFMGNDADPMSDTFAHGTGAAGVVAADPYTYNGYYNQGIAPGVKLIALRQSGSGQVKAALEWVLANREKYNIVAVNLIDYAGNAPSQYKGAMKDLIAAGVFVAHPSGNGGVAAGIAAALDPADYSVGSVNLSGAISTFTQRGAELDLLAPGEHVTLPYYDVTTGKHIYVDTADGTSWATPAVVGAAALIKQIDPRFTPAQVMGILQDSGSGVYDASTKLTYKRLNLNAALALAYERRALTPREPEASGPIEVPGDQAAYAGAPIEIGDGATTIEAEDFDAGGEGVAYHDVEAAALGGNAYRPGAGVDVESSVGGGRDVGFMRAGEWLEYTVRVGTAGTYALSARVASQGAGGRFHVEVDGVDRTGAIPVADTGGWQQWTTVGRSGVALEAGTHVIRVRTDAVGALGYVTNLDSISFARTSPAAAAAAAVDAFSPIAAADYSAQAGVLADRGFIEYAQQGDWVAYEDVDFGAAGATSFTAEVAALTGWGGRKIQVRLGSAGGAVIGTLTVPVTGSWTTFRSQTIAIARTVGVQDVYLTFAGNGWVGNVRSFNFA